LKVFPFPLSLLSFYSYSNFNNLLYLSISFSANKVTGSFIFLNLNKISAFLIGGFVGSDLTFGLSFSFLLGVAVVSSNWFFTSISFVPHIFF